MRWLQVGPHGSDASLTLVTWFPTMLPGSLKGLVLEVDDMEGSIAEIASKGFVIDGDIDEQPWGRFISFDDCRWQRDHPSTATARRGAVRSRPAPIRHEASVHHARRPRSVSHVL